MQAIRGDAIQSGVVQDDHAIGAACETTQRQQRVVRLHHDIADLVLVGEHTVGLHELFRKVIREALHDVRAHARASTAGNRVTQDEAFQTVASVGFAINDIEDFLLQLVTLAESTCPIVASTAAVLRQVNVLWIVELKPKA